MAHSGDATASGRLAGKVSVVTGGASGIGAETCRQFVAEGGSVVIADLQGDAAIELAAGLGDAAVPVVCDVTDEHAVIAAIELAADKWGRLDVMFNNAGIVGPAGPIGATDSDKWRNTIDVLLNSVFYGTKHAANMMVPQGSGSIISTTSIAGVIGGLGPHAYTAAKTAVVGLTKSVASEVAASGVRCNAIAPGSVPTALTARAIGGTGADVADVEADQIARYGYSMHVSDIAAAALYLASDESRYVNGHTLVVDNARSVNGGSARFNVSAD